MPAHPLTDEQKADAGRLFLLFKEWQDRQRMAGKPASQEQFAEALGFGQSALNQYLNGRIPLNVAAASKIAGVLGVEVREFSSALAEEIAALTTGGQGLVRPSPIGVRELAGDNDFDGQSGSEHLSREAKWLGRRVDRLSETRRARAVALLDVTLRNFEVEEAADKTKPRTPKA